MTVTVFPLASVVTIVSTGGMVVVAGGGATGGKVCCVVVEAGVPEVLCMVVDRVLETPDEKDPGEALVLDPAIILLVEDVEELLVSVGLTVDVVIVVTIVVEIYEVVMYVVGALLIMIVLPSPKML